MFNLIIPLGFAMGFRFFSPVEGRCQSKDRQWGEIGKIRFSASLPK